jgi:hypothetical protein
MSVPRKSVDCDAPCGVIRAAMRLILMPIDNGNIVAIHADQFTTNRKTVTTKLRLAETRSASFVTGADGG